MWKRDPHTAAKHQGLAGYYDAWLPILFTRDWVNRLTIPSKLCPSWRRLTSPVGR
jgi:hypothetical protein